MVNKQTERIFWNLIKDTSAIKEGHFCYTPNYHTKYYIDTEIIFQDPRYVEMVVKRIHEYFSNEHIDYIITPNFRSGYILAHNVGEIFNADVILLKRVDRNINFPPEFDIKGNVLIVDDGINTGNSLKQLLSITRHPEISIAGVGIFINRYPGDLEKDFGGLIKSVFSLKEKPFELINVNENTCELCEEYVQVKKALSGKALNESEKESLLLKFQKLEPRSAYGDIE